MTKQALLEQLRRHERRTIKLASLGGDPEQGFEQSFAQLAYSFVQDKAPTLLDHMLGFQLVERNEDNTKAIGLFGFKPGGQWLYAPVFFLNGDLKGHELLYLKNKDSFVPLKENWINYLMGKKPQILGEPIPQNLQQLGVMQPEISQLAHPPVHGKFASLRPTVAPWAVAGVQALARWVTQPPWTLTKFAGLDTRLDLRRVLAEDLRLVKAAVACCQAQPRLKTAMCALYGGNPIKTALETLAAKQARESCGSKVLRSRPKKPAAKQAAATTPAKVEVFDDVLTSRHSPELDEAERERLLRDGYLIRDHRSGEEVSKVYNVQVSQVLTNPDTTDVCEVLVRPSEFDRCLIVMHPHGSRGRHPGCLVVRLDGERRTWKSTHQTNVWIRRRPQGKHDQELFQDWLQKQSGGQPEEGASYVVLDRNGQGTAVFEVEKSLGDNTYKVYWPYTGSGSRRADYLPDVAPMPCDEHEQVELVIFNQREGTRFHSRQGKLYIPPDAVLLKLKDGPRCEKCQRIRSNCNCDYFRSSYDPDPDITLGTLADLQLEIMQKTSELKLWPDGHEIVVNRQRWSKKAALLHLIVQHGLREKVARQLIQEASRAGGKRYRVKYANPYPAMEGPGLPYFPEQEMYGAPLESAGGVPVQLPQTDFLEVPEMAAGNTDPAIYDPMQGLDPQTMQIAQQAQQTGQKEVFDTTMIAGLLKVVRQDSLVDRYLGDLAKALDRLGRILLLFYWHNEEFTERYGKQDMPELEDTLRNAFEVLGDLVLFLKEKTIEPMGGAGEIEPSIDDAARN